jgi:predicted  nucleic acid-binding Zn-ribbon protein
MREVIEKLLVLQDRDRKIIRTRAEIANVGPQRQSLLDRAATAQAALEAVKLKAKQLESERKKLELDVDGHKERIEKYSLQQFQTKKNEEYRALAHEIEMCKEAIVKIEDQELVFMEQIDLAQREAVAAGKVAGELTKETNAQVAALAEREANLNKQLAELESNRDVLAAGLDEPVMAKYNRLLKQRGDNIIVGIGHGVCGGCHMKLPTQVLVACQGESQLNACPHCGRILYYTRDMELAFVD